MGRNIMSFTWGKKSIALLAAGVTVALAAPIQASAMEGSIMPTAGIASFFEARLSAEEYIQAAEQRKGSHWGYTDIGIADVESGNLNVREQPSTSGKLVGKMPKNAACEVLEIADGWAYITSGEVTGYVNLDYLLTGPAAILKAQELVSTVAIAETDGLNVREEANIDSAILTKVLKGEELEYLETLEDWVKVSIDGEDAYVAAEYVTVKENLTTAITMSELLYGAGVSDVRVDMVEYAKQFVGNPYVWGGTSLTKGADCSGFVLSIYKKYGIKLTHSAKVQANEGKKISASELQPGDLVFYANGSGTINHVSMYIGGGQVIHASSPKTGIKISKYNYRTPVKYVSILQD